MPFFCEYKFVYEENVANMPFKICAVITLDAIKNNLACYYDIEKAYLKIRKVIVICFFTMFLYSLCVNDVR